MRLLVAHDGRDGGRDALEIARVLASSEADASALVVTVLVSGPRAMEYALLDVAETGDAEPPLEEARTALSEIEVETRAYVGGSPAGVLTDLAEAEDIDMIVIGSSHRGTIGRVVLGSVAESLLSGAPVDVVVAPAGYARAHHDPPRDIVVGYDGAPEARAALERAEALATGSNARIKLVTVVTPPVSAPVMVPGAFAPESPPEPDRVMNKGVNSVDRALAAEALRLDGDPATQLLRVCEEGADLLVVGSRGYGPLARVLLGSVSRKVIRRAPCPVIVVRRR